MIYSAAAVGVFAAQAASAATVVGAITNPSFETDAVGATSASTWGQTNRGTGTTSVAIVSSPGVTDGSKAVSITVTQGDVYGSVFGQGRPTGELLSVGMVNGETYRLTADFTPLISDGPQIEFGYAGANASFSSFIERYIVITTGSVAGVTTPVSIDFVFDSTTYDANWYFEVRTGNYAETPIEFTLDNYKISTIPEPTSFALLGLAGSAVALRRRRK